MVMPTAVVITFICMILAKMIRHFSSFEKHETWMIFLTSSGHKEIVAQSVMMLTLFALMPYPEEIWFTDGGLVRSIFIMFFVLPFANIAGELMDWTIYVRWWKKWKIKKAFGKGKEDLKMSQYQMNMIWEGRKLNVASRYALCFRLMVLTFIHAPLMPCAFFISSITMTIFYWVDKYKFFRVYSIPLRIVEQLDVNLTASYPWFMLTYAGGGIFVFGLLD